MAKDKEKDRDGKRRSAAPMLSSDDDAGTGALMFVSPIARPMADKRLRKKLLKTIKKASKHRHVRRGVREVVKSLRKTPAALLQTSLVVLAADISPMDVISHIPVLCEDHAVKYVWVPSKEELGAASLTKRATSCVMVIPGGGRKQTDVKTREAAEEEYGAGLAECRQGVDGLDVNV